MIFALCLLILGVCWWFACRQGVTGMTPRWVIAVAGLVPVVMAVALFFAGRGSLGDLRVSLEAFRFDMRAVDEVRVGGSDVRDHLVVRGLPPGYLRLQREGEALVVRIDPEQGNRVAAIRWRGPGDAGGPFHNAVPLGDGDVVAWGGDGALRWDAGARRFVTPEALDLATPEVPGRTSPFYFGIEIPVLKHLGPGLRLFPLRFYGLAEGGEGASPPDVTDLGSALVYWDANGLLNRQSWLLMTDPQMSIQRGEDRRNYSPVVARLTDGQRGHVDLYRMDYFADGRTGAFPDGRAQERRSFSITYQDGVARLILDTPSHVRVARGDWDRIQQRVAGAGDPLTMTLSEERTARTSSENRTFLNYRAVGEVMDHELFSAIQFPDGGVDVSVTTHSGRRGYEFGDAFVVGQKAGLVVRLFRFDTPLGLLVVMLAAALLATIAGMDVRRRPLWFVILSGVEMMLVVRVLIGYEAAMLDPEVAAGVWSSVLVMLAASLALQVGLIWYDEGKPDRLALIHWIGAPLLAVVVLLMVPTSWPRRMALLVFMAISPVLMWGMCRALDWLFRFIQDAAFRTSMWAKLPGSARATAVWEIWAAKPTLQKVVTKPWAAPLFWLGLLTVGLVLFRIMTMLVFGWKERMFLPIGAMAISVYYTPAALLLFAWLWRLRGRFGHWSFVVLWGMLGVIFLLIPAMARDVGTALIFPIPVMLLFALAWLAKPTRWKVLPLAVPLLVFVIFHAVLPTLAWFGAGKRFGDDAAYVAALEEPDTARRLLEQRLDEGINALRLWNQAAPDKLRVVGTTQAESLSVVMANLRAYAGRGIDGEGYLGPPLAGVLRDTHLNDNVSAIHMLGAHGWAGSLAFLAMLAAWSLIPLWLAGRADPDQVLDARTAFGMMILWTFFAAAMYMFSANVGLVLFTGKNVYFLAADSLSDALEGSLMAALALWALRGFGTRRAT